MNLDITRPRTQSITSSAWLVATLKNENDNTIPTNVARMLPSAIRFWDDHIKLQFVTASELCGTS